MGTKGYPSKVKKSKMRLESQRLADTERQRLRVTDTARQEETHPEEQGERQGLAEQRGETEEKEGRREEGKGEWGEEEVPHSPSSQKWKAQVRSLSCR